MTRITPVALLVGAVFAAGCGGGGGGGGGAASAPPSGLTPYVSYYDAAHTKIREQGQIDGQGRAQGQWIVKFENGQDQWSAQFVDDAFNPAAAWTEYNADGSIRFRSDDGAPIHTPVLAAR